MCYLIVYYLLLAQVRSNLSPSSCVLGESDVSSYNTNDFMPISHLNICEIVPLLNYSRCIPPAQRTRRDKICDFAMDYSGSFPQIHHFSAHFTQYCFINGSFQQYNKGHGRRKDVGHVFSTI